MPRQDAIQTNFTAGEVSPLLKGRIDTNKFKNGAEEITNFIVKPQGGLIRRNGTIFYGEVKDSSLKTIVQEFVFSTIQGYLLEFGNLYCRIWRNNRDYMIYDTTHDRVKPVPQLATGIPVTAMIGHDGNTRIHITAADHGFKMYPPGLSPEQVYIIGTQGCYEANGTWNVYEVIDKDNFVINTPFLHAWTSGGTAYREGPWQAGTAITNAVAVAPRIQVTSVGHGLVAGDTVRIKNVTGTTELNGGWPVYSKVDDDNFIINVTLVNAYTGGGTVEKGLATPLEVVTPYTTADLDELYFCQSADTLYICHPKYQPRKLLRTSDYHWTLTLYEPFDGPYMDYDTNDVVLTATILTDTATLISNVAHFTADPASPDRNKYLEFYEAGHWRLAKILTVPSTTEVTVDIVEAIKLSSPADKTWQAQPITPGAYNGLYGDTWYKFQKMLADKYGVGFTSKLKYQPKTDHKTYYAGAQLSGGAALVSSYANTFVQQDVGKVIKYRSIADTWYQLSGITDDTHASGVLVAPYKIAVAGHVISLVHNSRVVDINITASSPIFNSSDVGRSMRLNYETHQVYAKIHKFNTTSSVDAYIYQDFPLNTVDATLLYNNGKTAVWRWGAWSETTGWPALACFHEQRLIFARTATQPQTIWGSCSGDFENMSPTEPDSTVLDESAYTYTIASNEVNGIVWLASATVFLIGTIGGEWQCRAASGVNNPITSKDITVVPQTAYGSIPNARVGRFGSALLYLTRSGKKIRSANYNYYLDSFESKDLTIASEHILRKGTRGVKTAFAREPTSILWVLTSDGTLAALTYDSDQEVFAWSYHSFADAVVESLAVLPSSDGNNSEVYLVIRRTINGTTKRYIELMDGELESNLPGDCNYLDCATYWDATLGGGISSSYMSYLEGKTVYCYVSPTSARTTGLVLGPFVVAGGVVNWGVHYDRVRIGLPMTSALKTLPLDANSGFGTGQGKTKRIHRLDLRLWNSQSFKHGKVNDSTLIAEQLTTDGSLFTGDKSVVPDLTLESEANYFIVCDTPEPCNILSLMPIAEVNE